MNEKEEQIKLYLQKAAEKKKLSDKDFAAFMRLVLTGYPGADNATIAIDLADKIWKHKILWKLFSD